VVSISPAKNHAKGDTLNLFKFDFIYQNQLVILQKHFRQHSF